MRTVRNATITVDPDLWSLAGEMDINRSSVVGNALWLAVWARLRWRYTIWREDRERPFRYENPPASATEWVKRNPIAWREFQREERKKYEERLRVFEKQEVLLRDLAARARVPWDEVIAP